MQQGNEFSFADLASELSELTREANRANATIYTIDPRGLVGMPDLDQKVDMMDFQNYVTTSQNSLRVLAEQTGGFAMVNQNDFDEGAEADRRGDERLLRARLLLVQSRSDAAAPQGRNEGEPPERRPALPHRIHAEADQGAGCEAAHRSRSNSRASSGRIKRKGRPALPDGPLCFS